MHKVINTHTHENEKSERMCGISEMYNLRVSSVFHSVRQIKQKSIVVYERLAVFFLLQHK